jgi:LysR family nitrogen assimilation transcriptional regulator
VESRQLRYFVAIARCGSFTRAAETIRVAQPALSAQIAKLEREVGAALFIRGPRGISLTPSGECLMEHAAQITEHLDRALREVRAGASAITTTHTIGLAPLIAPVIAVPLIEAVQQDLPDVRLHVRDAGSSTLREWVTTGRLDSAIFFAEPNDVPDRHITLLQEHLYVGVLKDLGYRFQQFIELEDLRDIPLVLSTANNVHRRQLQGAARRRGFNLWIAAEIDSIRGQRELVLKGAGAIVMPWSGFEGWPLELLTLGRLGGNDLIALQVFAQSAQAAQSPATQGVSGVVSRVFADLITSAAWQSQKLQSHAGVIMEGP